MSQIEEYLKKHNIKHAVEQVVNAAVKQNAPEPYSVMSALLLRMAPAQILAVHARQIFDSRGLPTIEATVETFRGRFSASVPSGASTGAYEAVELRDGGSAYMGKGVSRAVSNVNELIGPALLGKDPTAQAALDRLMARELDGSENDWGYTKQKLGANAVLAVSIALCKAGAAQQSRAVYRYIADLAGVEETVLPVPAFNVINGGSHAANKLALQEFMIMPTGAGSLTEALKMGSETYQHLKQIVQAKYGMESTSVGDEGGFAPLLHGTATSQAAEVLDLLVEAIEAAGYTGKIDIAIDAAASEFYSEDDKTYDLDFKTDGEDKDAQHAATAEGLRDMYIGLCTSAEGYPIASIEDPFEQDDWESTAELTARDLSQVVGDDLLVTNPKRVTRAIEKNACNALLLKLNQIGTVSEAIDAVRLAKGARWGVMCSHRSGDTEDHFIADLAVGLSCGQIKTGALCRSERVAKYNRLLQIESELGDQATYAGLGYRHVAWPVAALARG
jgi:enolase